MLVICTLVLLLLVVEATAFGHSPAAGRYALALANAFLLSAALLSAFAVVAVLVDEQVKVIGITLGSTLVMYVATGALKAADAPAWIRYLMPFEHYHSAEAMSGDGLPLWPVALLLLATAIATAVAFWWYGRRDLA
jgi:hypothetical protein